LGISSTVTDLSWAASAVTVGGPINVKNEKLDNKEIVRLLRSIIARRFRLRIVLN